MEEFEQEQVLDIPAVVPGFCNTSFQFEQPSRNSGVDCEQQSLSGYLNTNLDKHNKSKSFSEMANKREDDFREFLQKQILSKANNG